MIIFPEAFVETVTIKNLKHGICQRKNLKMSGVLYALFFSIKTLIQGFLKNVPGTRKSETPNNFTVIAKIHLKCDCISEPLVNGIREFIFYKFGLSSPPGHKMNTFFLQQISRTRNLDANLILRQFRLDLLARFMENTSINTKMKQKETAKELSFISSSLRRYRNDMKM